MNNNMIFPKIKRDTWGTPIEISLEQVPFEEVLRAPEDVKTDREIFNDYSDKNQRFMPSSMGRGQF